MAESTVCGVTIRTNARGLVGWMSDWSRWPELVAAGILEPVWAGPGTYGHVDLVLIGGAS